MKIDRSVKVAAFCRELRDDTLAKLASQRAMEETYLRAVKKLRAGEIDRQLEEDLDALDSLARKVLHYSLYSTASRTYSPPPIPAQAGAGAQWWTCPHGWCAGRGRVRPGQVPPMCTATVTPLEAGPFPQ